MWHDKPSFQKLLLYAQGMTSTFILGNLVTKKRVEYQRQNIYNRTSERVNILQGANFIPYGTPSNISMDIIDNMYNRSWYIT